MAKVSGQYKVVNTITDRVVMSCDTKEEASATCTELLATRSIDCFVRADH